MTDLLTIREVCEVLKISRRHFDNIRHRLPSPVILGPRTLRWRPADLEKWLQSQKKAA